MTSRRDLLKIGGAAFAGAALGIGGWETLRLGWRNGYSPEKNLYNSEKPSGSPQVESARTPAEAPQKIIDTHVHVVRANLPGSTNEEPDDRDGELDDVAGAIGAQLKSAGVEHALCMPTYRSAGDVLGVERTRQLASRVSGLHPVGIADPERGDEESLEKAEESLARGDVVALKAYLGYLHFAPDDPGYRAYYKLAAKYKIPVIFHTGDTYSHLARLKHAHPLPIDDLAVDFPETNFVLAHLGNPWLIDAAELIYKNNKPQRENVWADLSGLVVGTAEDLARMRREGTLGHVLADVRKAIAFAERPDRFLFGSDWPLAPIGVYRDFIAELIPAEMHQAVFYDNARKLFRL